jgi:hypothetical protein
MMFPELEDVLTIEVNDILVLLQQLKHKNRPILFIFELLIFLNYSSKTKCKEPESQSEIFRTQKRIHITH